MLLEITSTFAGKVAFITHVAGTCIQTWKIFQGEISHFWIHFQNFKMGPLEDFEKKKVQGWENHFRFAKFGFSEIIFPTDWGYIWSEKSGFRFSFGAPRVPEPKDQIQRLQLQNLDQSPASKFLTKLHFQRQYHSSIKWVSLYWNENDRTLVQ